MISVRVVHALNKRDRKTTLDFALSFGRYAPKQDFSVEYVNPLLTSAARASPVDISVFTYELLSLRTSPFWADIETRIIGFAQKSVRNVLLPQDDYTASKYLDRLAVEGGFDAIYSPLGKDLDKVYPKSLKKIPIHTILTGYFNPSDCFQLEEVTPDDYYNRAVDFAGRVRDLPPYFGEAAQLKAEFSNRVADEFFRKGRNVDFSTDASAALLGDQWKKLLESARYTPVAKGGASRVDPWGLEARKFAILKSYCRMSDEDSFRLAQSHSAPNGDFSAIGPRFFEAIASGAALIMPEDFYFLGFSPGIHYLAVKPDYENLIEIEISSRQPELWVELSNNARRFLAESEHLTYLGFVKELLFREASNIRGSEPTRFQSMPTTELPYFPEFGAEKNSRFLTVILEMVRKGKDAFINAVELHAVSSAEALDFIGLKGAAFEYVDQIRSGKVLLSSLHSPYYRDVESLT